MTTEVLAVVLRTTHDAHEALVDAQAAWAANDIGSADELKAMAATIEALRRRNGELRDRVAADLIKLMARNSKETR